MEGDNSLVHTKWNWELCYRGY